MGLLLQQPFLHFFRGVLFKNYFVFRFCSPIQLCNQVSLSLCLSVCYIAQ